MKAIKEKINEIFQSKEYRLPLIVSAIVIISMSLTNDEDFVPIILTIPLSVLLSYCCHERKGVIYSIVVILLWLAGCLACIFEHDGGFWRVESFRSLYIFLFICSFVTTTKILRGEKNDLKLTDFIIQNLFRLVIAVLLSFIVTFLLGILLYQFGCSKLTTIGFLALCSAPFFIALRPSAQSFAQMGSKVDLPRITKGLVRTLLFPSIFAITVVIYAFFVKALFILEFPYGFTLMISVLFILVVVMKIVMYPLEYGSPTRYESIVLKYTPFLMIPLLFHMTIEIGRTIYDYGITTTRLYTVFWLVFCVITLLLMIFNKERWLRYSMMCFTTLLLIATCGGPLSIKNITFRVISSDIKGHVENAGLTLPVEEDDILFLKKQLDAKEFNKFVEECKHLEQDFPITRTKNIIDIVNEEGFTILDSTKNNRPPHNIVIEFNKQNNILKGYKYFAPGSYNYDVVVSGENIRIKWDGTTFSFPKKELYQFIPSIKELQETNEYTYTKYYYNGQKLILKNEKACLVIKTAKFNPNPESQPIDEETKFDLWMLSGSLFYNE
jgi:hypothetical protein